MAVLLEGKSKHYAWGKVGDQSLVYQLLRTGNRQPPRMSFDSKPWAELWVGAHQDGEATLAVTGESLTKFCIKNALNYRFSSKGDVKKPIPTCLLKVLSIQKPLSIQCHPNREDARKLLVARHRDIKDAEHKPEIAIAVSDRFGAFAGFEPIDVLKKVFEGVPCLAALNPPSFDGPEEEIYRWCLEQMMSEDPTLLATIHSFQTGEAREYPLLRGKLLGDKEKLFNYVCGCFPADCGVLAAFFMNRVELHHGDAIFLSPGLLHAYIYGDCVEVMAPSDNVLRGGLTPKNKDPIVLPTLARLEPLGAEHFTPPINSKDFTYKSDAFDDFSVRRILLEKGHRADEPAGFSRFGLVLAGRVRVGDRILDDGSVFLTQADRELTFEGLSEKPSEIFLAGTGE